MVWCDVVRCVLRCLLSDEERSGLSLCLPSFFWRIFCQGRKKPRCTGTTVGYTMPLPPEGRGLCENAQFQFATFGRSSTHSPAAAVFFAIEMTPAADEVRSRRTSTASFFVPSFVLRATTAFARTFEEKYPRQLLEVKQKAKQSKHLQAATGSRNRQTYTIDLQYINNFSVCHPKSRSSILPEAI